MSGVVAFIPSCAACAAARRPSSRFDALSSASTAGIRASTIVLSSGWAFPRAWTPSRPLRQAAAYAGRSTSSCPARALPICKNSVPYSGPAAPPTVDTSAIATVLSTAPGSACSAAPRRSSALVMPRFMLGRWSPSPSAVWSAPSSSRGSDISPPNRGIQSSVASRVIATVSRPGSPPSRAPAQGRGVHRSVPVAQHLVVELEQGDRAALHLERGDVVADQVALDLQAVLLRDLCHPAVHHVQLDQRRAAHAVHEHEHPIAARAREILDDRRHQALGDLRRGTDLLAEAARLTVDADADLHLVLTELEARLA